MADVSRIQGPSGPPDRSGPSKARKADAGKFQEELRRVDEVSSIDPDEAKKRKRPEETVREEDLARAAGKEIVKTPAREPTDTFSKVASEGAGGSSEKNPTAAEPPPSEEKISLNEQLDTYAEHRQAAEATLAENKEQLEVSGMLKSKSAEVQEGVTIPATPETPDETKKIHTEETGSQQFDFNNPSSPQQEPIKVEETLPEEKLGFSEEPPPAYTHLHPDVLDIMERIVGGLVYLDHSGIKETTITISSSAEKPSIFEGARITLREYSTAPKQFNIELSGSPKAVDLFQTNMQDLKSAFEVTPYAFKVNSIETSLQ